MNGHQGAAMIDPTEKWQVEVNGEIYEAEFADLLDWIAERSLLETDKVSRGNLRWLEAGKVPALAKHFRASVHDPKYPEGLHDNLALENGHTHSDTDVSVSAGAASEASVIKVQSVSESYCIHHAETDAKYICNSCRGKFCKICPKSYGGTVKLCPTCGEMCSEIKAVEKERNRAVQYQNEMSEGFGFADFGKALGYPFQFNVSLVFGGLIFAILTLGKSAAGFGGIFMLSAALICVLLANALTFGVLANTIDNFSLGYTSRDFMPPFDGFSIWDDVVHPFFLSLAVYISSFGLFLLLVLAAGWMVWSSFAGQLENHATKDLSRLAESKPQLNLKQIREISELSKERRSMIERETRAAEGLTDGETMQTERAADLQKLQNASTDRTQDPFGIQLEDIEGGIENTDELQKKTAQAMFYEVTKRAGILLVFAGLAFVWGLLYFPAACCVAGYTRSFWSTLNPLIGLDTIKHLGFDYVKILFMGFILSAVSGFLMLVLGIVFSPFNLGQFGNPPLTFFGSLITFYFSVVFAVMLGYAIHKNGDKLNVYRA
ncbi:MAG: hypothetical protein R2681_10950 [Pyrinomonadaceae bacterium]